MSDRERVAVPQEGRYWCADCEEEVGRYHRTYPGYSGHAIYATVAFVPAGEREPDAWRFSIGTKRDGSTSWGWTDERWFAEGMRERGRKVEALFTPPISASEEDDEMVRVHPDYFAHLRELERAAIRRGEASPTDWERTPPTNVSEES